MKKSHKCAECFVGRCESHLEAHRGREGGSYVLKGRLGIHCSPRGAQVSLFSFPVLLTLCIVTNVGECPTRHLTAPSPPRSSTFLVFQYSCVEAAGTIKFTSNRLADTTGALDESFRETAHENRHTSRHPVPHPGIAGQCACESSRWGVATSAMADA